MAPRLRRRRLARETRSSRIPRNRTPLVIVNGQIRGGPHCWLTFKRYVLDYFMADLALLKPRVNENDEAVFWEQRARFVMDVEEHEEWGTELTRINGGNSSWDILIKNTTQFRTLLGGVQGQIGSSGILLAYRHYARFFLRDILRTEAYQWVVYVRSD